MHSSRWASKEEVLVQVEKSHIVGQNEGPLLITSSSGGESTQSDLLTKKYPDFF